MCPRNFLAATFIKAGFDIEYEDETDFSRKHTEFVATHKVTAMKLSVEAKSKHRVGVPVSFDNGTQVIRQATYTRVSLKDSGQDPENQGAPLRNLARAIGVELVEEYVDYASGGSSDRKNFIRMLADSDKHKFNLLLIWSLDRFSREGIGNILGYLEWLKRSGVAVKSLQEPWLDTRDQGLGQLLLAIFSWVAKQERKRIVERTKAGLDRARRDGKKLGRPAGSKDSKKRKKSGVLFAASGRKIAYEK